MINEIKYIPALGFHALTRLYDKVIKWTMPENKFRTKLINYLAPEKDEKILEFGFGTAQNMIYALNAQCDSFYFGIDVDPMVKAIAEEKLSRHGYSGKVDLKLYRGHKLPYPSNYFDKVFSCLVFHQLGTKEKKIAFSELHRILKVGGCLIICDWGTPSNFTSNIGFHLVQLLDGFHNTSENKKGLLPKYLLASGCTEIKKIDKEDTKIGTLEYIIAYKK